MERNALKFWKIFAILLVLINITLIVFLLLKPIGKPNNRKEENIQEKYLSEKLNFSVKQENQLMALRKTHHDSIEVLLLEAKKLKKIFFDGLKSDPVKTNVDSIANKIVENQKQIELITYQHFAKVKEICSPDQKIIFNDIIEDVLKKFSQQRKNNNHP